MKRFFSDVIHYLLNGTSSVEADVYALLVVHARKKKNKKTSLTHRAIKQLVFLHVSEILLLLRVSVDDR